MAKNTNIDKSKNTEQNTTNYSGEDLLSELDQELGSGISLESPARSSDTSHLPSLPNRQSRLDTSIDSHVESQVTAANSSVLEAFGGRNKVLVGASTVRKPVAAINFADTSRLKVPFPKPGMHYRLVNPNLHSGRIQQMEDKGYIIDTEQTPDGSPFWIGDLVVMSRLESVAVVEREVLAKEADKKDPSRVTLDASPVKNAGAYVNTEFKQTITTS